ncbi:unnamed protein product [Spodoptera exigua]|nr:unnamed protein product [Spodoptera exigua]
MLHNATARAHFVECLRTRQAEYINEAGLRGAPTPPQRLLSQSHSTAQYVEFSWPYMVFRGREPARAARTPHAPPPLIARLLITSTSQTGAHIEHLAIRRSPQTVTYCVCAYTRYT